MITTVKNLDSALLLKVCQKKQENEEGQMGCGFPAVDLNRSYSRSRSLLIFLPSVLRLLETSDCPLSFNDASL